MRQTTRWLVPDDAATAASASSQSRVTLRSSDVQFLWLPEVAVGYLFPTTQLDELAVTRGLERALALYPLLAGRMGTHVDAGNVKRLHIDLAPRGGKGALWEVVLDDSDAPLPASFSAADAADRRFFPPAARLLPALWEPIWRRPLLRARLTQLTAHGASVLALCAAHAALDGASAHAFVSAWSHFAGLEAAAGGDGGAKAPLVLPAKLPAAASDNDGAAADSDFDFERLVADAATEHDEQRRGVRGGTPLAAWRMSVWDLALWIPQMYVAHFTDVVADFALSVEDVAALKAAAASDDGDHGDGDGEWLTSFQVVAAALCRALADADSGVAAAAAPNRPPYHVRVLANSRGRERLSLDADYVGNALSFARAHISPQAQRQKQPLSAWLPRAARDVRRSLRAALADGAAMERRHAGFEHGARAVGANAWSLERLRWYQSWRQNFSSGDAAAAAATVINSWASFPWLDVSFGARARPTRMRVPASLSYRRLVVIAPRSEAELCVRVQLPAAKLRRFEAAVEALGLPLRRFF